MCRPRNRSIAARDGFENKKYISQIAKRKWAETVLGRNGGETAKGVT